MRAALELFAQFLAVVLPGGLLGQPLGARAHARGQVQRHARRRVDVPGACQQHHGLAGRHGRPRSSAPWCGRGRAARAPSGRSGFRAAGRNGPRGSRRCCACRTPGGTDASREASAMAARDCERGRLRAQHRARRPSRPPSRPGRRPARASRLRPRPARTSLRLRRRLAAGRRCERPTWAISSATAASAPRAASVSIARWCMRWCSGASCCSPSRMTSAGSKAATRSSMPGIATGVAHAASNSSTMAWIRRRMQRY